MSKQSEAAPSKPLAWKSQIQPVAGTLANITQLSASWPICMCVCTYVAHSPSHGHSYTPTWQTKSAQQPSHTDQLMQMKDCHQSSCLWIVSFSAAHNHTTLSPTSLHACWPSCSCGCTVSNVWCNGNDVDVLNIHVASLHRRTDTGLACILVGCFPVYPDEDLEFWVNECCQLG